MLHNIYASIIFAVIIKANAFTRFSYNYYSSANAFSRNNSRNNFISLRSRRFVECTCTTLNEKVDFSYWVLHNKFKLKKKFYDK